MSIGRLLFFNQPSICHDPGTVTIPQYRVNKTKQHTHGRYRRSIRIHLLENTVDIDGRQGFTYLRIWSISMLDKDSHTGIRSISHRPSISDKNRSKSTVDVDSYQKKIGRYRPSMCPHTKRNLSTVDIDRRIGHGLKKIVNIDFTHL